MSLSLRRAYGEQGTSLRSVARTVVVPPPPRATTVTGAFLQTRVHTDRIVTPSGVALGGAFRLELRSDGFIHFSGFVHASGWPSYRASITVTVRVTLPGPDGVARDAAFSFADGGTAYGTNRKGARRYSWAQNTFVAPVAAHWAQVRSAPIVRNVQYSTDALGVVGDGLALLGQLALANATLGVTGAGLVVAGRAADALDAEELLVPGLVGVVASGGAVLVLGPGAAYPAFWAGAATARAAIEHRHLTGSERRACDDVFGPGRIPYDKVVLTNLLGLGDRPFTVPHPGGPILVNIGRALETGPLRYGGDGHADDDARWPRGHVFFHEMTHVWQAVHTRFTPALYCRAVVASTLRHYSYPDTPWADSTSWGTDQQANIVADWWCGRGNYSIDPALGQGPAPEDRQAAYGARNPRSPWFAQVAALRGGVE